MKSSRALLTVCAFRPAWVSTPAVRAAVDTFYSSALASVRPTTSSARTLRCPQTFGRLRLLLRDSLCNSHRRMPSRLLGTPCRTEHRSESWAIPSLCRATPSATSEHLVELLGSSPIPRSFVASCVSFQLRLLPSTGVTRLRRYCKPLRHPSQPGLSLASCQLIHAAITAGTSRVAYGPLCLHAVANTPAGLLELVRSYRSTNFGLPTNRGGSAPALSVSGPAQRSLTLRPARSPSRLATLYTRGSSSLGASPAALIAIGWSEPVPGRVYPRCGPTPFHGAPEKTTTWPPSSFASGMRHPARLQRARKFPIGRDLRDGH